MKKIVFLVLFGAFATSLSAQFLLGGQFNFGTMKDKTEGTILFDGEETTTLVTVMPRLAFQSGDLWFGIDGGVTMINDKSESGGTTTEDKTTLFSIGPFVRYTKHHGDNFGIWIEAHGAGTFGNEKDEDDNELAKYSGFRLGLRPGVVFFIGDHLSFEASFGSLGYNSFTITDPEDSDVKETISNAGLILNDNQIMLDARTLSISSAFRFGVNWLF